MSKGARAIYPGSFDPITNGHLDILDRSLKVFSEVRILVATSVRKTKSGLLTPAERVALIKQVVATRQQVSVELWPGLIMDYAKRNKFDAVIRGLRAASDFEYEFMMASMNKRINPKIETVFMMTSQDLYFVSSSMVKELFSYDGDISSYVPPKVLRYLKNKFPKGILQNG